jgi:hypothetical protein
MTTGRGSFAIEDGAFWTDPLARRDALETQLDQAAEQVVFDAPAEVRLDERRATLPIPVLRGAPNAPQFHVDFFHTAVLVATSRRTRRSFAATLQPVLTEEFRRVSGAAPREPEGWYTEALVVDARERLDLPWGEPDTLWLTLLLRDRVLGRTTVRLTERVDYLDPEAERFLEAERQRSRPLPIWPRSGPVLPSWDRQERSPVVPPQPGLAITVERVVPSREPEQCVLWGSYRIPIEPRDRVVGPGFETLSRQATAIVPIALLVIGSKRAVPTLWHLAVPCLNPLAEHEGDLMAHGHFTLDLQQLANFCLVPQTYFFYAFAGELSTEAAPLAIVTVR